MGGYFSSLMNRVSQFYGNPEVRLLMAGIDGAGKSTILYQLKLGKVFETVPTFGYNVETIGYRNLSLVIWDLTGQSKHRIFWKYYYSTDVKALIFVVDANDRYPYRMEEARKALQLLLVDELKDAPLLIFANKQDLSEAMSTDELIEILQLNTINDRKWHIQSTSATTGVGLYDGLDWLCSELQPNEKLEK